MFMSRLLVLCAMWIGESEWALMFASMVLVMLKLRSRWFTWGRVLCSAFMTQLGRYPLMEF